MEARESHATQVHEDEGHAGRAEAQEESKEDDHGGGKLGVPGLQLSPQQVLLIDILDEELHKGALDDPLLEVLAADADFQRTLDSICQRLATKAPPYYSWEDLKQDVFIKFGRWFWRYRFEASLKTVLRKIALNQLIDVRRPQGAQSLSLEDLLPPEYGIEFDVPAPQALADVEDNLQVGEWLAALTGEQRELFVWYHLEGRSLADFARERGVSRQAVDRRWLRILKKLRPLVGADA
ncbi:MAG TPA: sigma-70 family RNA polymerase sigma factor [Pyrinomonadaceae bacterium]|jgi:RNA polymerase sigma factor (sigma-70 family)